ncbi:hypothetical protein HK098_002371 [Nowakowskiella sp. JEL0407]|nr:hypothetical protein HK098_002371 [Nowakowskiella sp. JEL0407]
MCTSKSPNAFVLFRTCVFPIEKTTFPENLNQQNSIVIGTYWLHAPDTTKEYFNDIAENLALIKPGEPSEFTEEQLRFMAQNPPGDMIPSFEDENRKLRMRVSR